MMSAYNEMILQDVYFHLDKLKGDFAQQKIEYNRNPLIVYAMTDFTQKIHLIEQIVKSYDNHNFKLLTNKINEVLLKDPELQGVQVIIKKSNNINCFDASKTALITHLI
ncbi:MAG: hypothetical protein CFE24_11065 [Flavobacterium sp. BFFFF2]|nr:MAG: hypothetical protein CFE24_11065 [Flavobacterium sp. BFFFF2]